MKKRKLRFFNCAHYIIRLSRNGADSRNFLFRAGPPNSPGHGWETEDAPPYRTDEPPQKRKAAGIRGCLAAPNGKQRFRKNLGGM